MSDKPFRVAGDTENEMWVEAWNGETVAGPTTNQVAGSRCQQLNRLFKAVGSRLTVVRGSDDWSALYVDGAIDSVGDKHNIRERVYELLGVTVIDSDDFLLGQNQRTGVAKTLSEMLEYTRWQEEREREASELEEKAAALRDRAKTIREWARTGGKEALPGEVVDTAASACEASGELPWISPERITNE